LTDETAGEEAVFPRFPGLMAGTDSVFMPLKIGKGRAR